MDRRGGAAPRPHGRHRLCLDGSNTVFSDDLVNGEVKGLDLGADSVGSGKVADGSVKNADLSTGASSSNTIADGGIQSIDVKDDTLTAADLAPVQSPIQPQLENCAGSTQWIGAPAQAEQPAFWKDPFGVVHLEGAVGCPDNADEGTVIFQLSAGLRATPFHRPAVRGSRRRPDTGTAGDHLRLRRSTSRLRRPRRRRDRRLHLARRHHVPDRGVMSRRTAATLACRDRAADQRR